MGGVRKWDGRAPYPPWTWAEVVGWAEADAEAEWVEEEELLADAFNLRVSSAGKSMF